MPELSQRRRSLVLAICCASIVVVVMDISIVNVALPAIRRDLHASVSGLQWTVDAYTLMLASFLVLAGSTADRTGRRRVFQIGLAAFGLGSLLCGLAPGIGWLIAARVLQAAGGTMLNPVAMSIVANTFPDPGERARAIGVFGSVSGLSLALGPILGGALVDGFGWRSIFWVNVPIVAAAAVCTGLFVPESRAARARRFDPVGQALVFLVLGSVVYAIIASGGLGWASPVTLGLLAVAGLCLLPVGVTIVVLAPLSGRLVGGHGPRLPLAASGAALALGGVASIWLGPATPLPAVLAVYLLFGIAVGTVNPPITNTAVSGMPASMAGVAASLASAGRQTGTTLGVAVSGAVVGSALAHGGMAFTGAARGVWWMVLGLGLGILALGLLSTGRWAQRTAGRAAALFEQVDRGELSAQRAPARAARR